MQPLADRMRPKILADIVGQEALIKDRLQRYFPHVPSMILHGPPGSGKTTLARAIAKETHLEYTELSAVTCGLADVRRVIKEAPAEGAILFLDEIHRFNRAQQDALLPHLEKGTVSLIGATVENPYGALNRALISRMHIFELKALDQEDLEEILRRVFRSENGLPNHTITDEALTLIIQRTAPDARAALTLLEGASLHAQNKEISVEDVESASDRRNIRYGTTEHYDHASALIKSMRKGHPERALQILASMLAGGEDPMFIARRVAIFASEDVGPADTNALQVATNCLLITERIGMPEAGITLSQAVRYMAEAPKNRQAYDDIKRMTELVKNQGTPQIPLHLTNRKKPHS